MKKIILVCMLLLTLHACKRSTDAIGPQACPSDHFALTSSLVFKDAAATGPDLNLLNSWAIVSLSFNETISYQLKITGSVSGAQFIYNGKGSSLNYNWYGASTNGKYFTQGDALTCTVTNICKNEPLGGTISLNLSTIVGYTNGEEVLVINYESGAPIGYGPISPMSACNASTLMIPTSVGYTASPQGGNYYKYKATCGLSNSPSYYFGNVSFTPASAYSTLPTDPTRVYLNFFARGAVNSQAQFILTEKSHGSSLTRKFFGTVAPNKWTKFSAKLSDLGVINPSAITDVSFNLGAVNPSVTGAEVDLDLVIFTVDKPL